MPQSLSNILLHLTFSTKERRLMLPYEPLPALHRYAAGIFKDQKCHMIEMNNVSDHVHILFELHRTASVANVVMHVKKGTSRHLKELSPEYADFDWQEGYGIFSLGASQRDATKTYLRGQQEHHRKRKFPEEFRELLAKYDIEYDERYVWG